MPARRPQMRAAGGYRLRFTTGSDEGADTNMIEPFNDVAPSGSEFTDYDRAHIKLYMRLHDAHEDGADWREAVRIIFGVDPDREPDRALRIHESHLARARWMIASGYRHLLAKSQH